MFEGTFSDVVACIVKTGIQWSISGVRQVLTLSSIQTNSDTFANNADQDETARNETSHLGLHC